MGGRGGSGPAAGGGRPPGRISRYSTWIWGGWRRETEKEMMTAGGRPGLRHLRRHLVAKLQVVQLRQRLLLGRRGRRVLVKISEGAWGSGAGCLVLTRDIWLER